MDRVDIVGHFGIEMGTKIGDGSKGIISSVVKRDYTVQQFVMEKGTKIGNES